MDRKTEKALGIIGDVLGGIAFAAFMVAMCWLCCAVSGYHFE